jgi:hypothetical protein
MAENATVETDASADDFVAAVESPARRDDARTLLAMMRRATGVEPRMWGGSIVGFGRYHYRYESGREGDWARVGFSPRKANLAIYLSYKPDDYPALLERLGKHSTGASCLYVRRLADVDLAVLEEMVAGAWRAAAERHGAAE